MNVDFKTEVISNIVDRILSENANELADGFKPFIEDAIILASIDAKSMWLANVLWDAHKAGKYTLPELLTKICKIKDTQVKLHFKRLYE